MTLKDKPILCAIANKVGPTIALDNASGKLGISLSLLSDEPALMLGDARGVPRAILGNSELEDSKTGANENTGPSSLVLFDKKGKVIWRMP